MKRINEPTGVEMLIREVSLDNGGVLKVYTHGKYNSKFKFVYEDDKGKKYKKMDRVLKDRMPMAELRTGIHDKKLSDFTGKNVRFFR